jgi:hypothetical protein
MNKCMLNLFNNGDNNGTIILTAEDNSIIKCHDFVFESQCNYIKAKFDPEPKEKCDSDPRSNDRISLNYPAKAIQQVLSKMYTDEFSFNNLEPTEIIQLVLLIHELDVKNRYEQISELNKLFESKLNENNWLELLDIIYQHSLFKIFQRTIVNYFIHQILIKNTAVFPDITVKDANIKKYLLNIFKKFQNKEISKPINKDIFF